MRALIWDLGGTLVDTYPDVDRALAGARARIRTGSRCTRSRC
ncbi:hypothetical protein [Brachybacterium sp. GPGPB12]